MELKLKHRYLVRTRPSSSITELKVVEITKSSIKAQFENGNTLWYHKEHDKFWEIIEDLGISKFLSESKRRKRSEAE